MDYTDRENYFSVYMKKKENIKSNNKKSDLNKQNKTIKNHNYTNLNIKHDNIMKKIIYQTSEKKEKSSLNFIRNQLFNNKEKVLNEEDKKINFLQQKIFKIIDLIDNFKDEYLYKNKRSYDKVRDYLSRNREQKEKNFSLNNLKNKQPSYRSISTTNIENHFSINNNSNNSNNKKKRNISSPKSQKKEINIFNKKITRNNHLITEKKYKKETLIKRKIEYGNLITKKNTKRNKSKNLSQSQIFFKKTIYQTPRTKKLNNNNFENNNSSTREISDRKFNNKKNTKIINSSRENRIRAIIIKDFSQLIKMSQDENNNNNCISERTHKVRIISKKIDFENL